MFTLTAPSPPVKANRPRKPPVRRPHERSVKVIITPCPGQPLTLIRSTQDGEVAHYWVSPLPSDWGLAYRLEKAGEEGDDTYDVLLENEQDASCTCPGHTYHGYCKNVDALRALLAESKLPLPPVAHGSAEGADEPLPF
jgi:hypothetical protein